MNEPIPQIPVVFEDKCLIVVNKPPGMLSQPGRTEPDSVHTRVQQHRPDATGPMLVHRLDMDTSGLLILAKHRAAHRHLQQQFEKRRVAKRYRALLKARPLAAAGRIVVPLRLNIDNRPQQIACWQHGKQAVTVWVRDSAMAENAVILYPMTGRTHQLRVHMADPMGLHNAILGDQLYGPSRKSEGVDRMMLHADRLEFEHPTTGVRMVLQSPVSFPAMNREHP